VSDIALSILSFKRLSTDHVLKIGPVVVAPNGGPSKSISSGLSISYHGPGKHTWSIREAGTSFLGRVIADKWDRQVSTTRLSFQ
jgi:hypothetical protein